MTAAILLNTTDDYFYTVVHIAFIAILTKSCTSKRRPVIQTDIKRISGIYSPPLKNLIRCLVA